MRSRDITLSGLGGFVVLLDDIFGGRLLLELSLLLALHLGALLFLARQFFLPFLEGLTWAHWLAPLFCAWSMRGMEELAQHQFGQLSFVDGFVAAGAVPDHFILLRFWLGFEQKTPPDLSHVMGGDVMFPIALTQAQFGARCVECLQCGRVAGRAGFRAQRQFMPRAQVMGERSFPCLCKGFQFPTTSGLQQRGGPGRIPGESSGHVVRLLHHSDSLPGVRFVIETMESSGAGVAILNDSRKVARHPTYKVK